MMNVSLLPASLTVLFLIGVFSASPTFAFSSDGLGLENNRNDNTSSESTSLFWYYYNHKTTSTEEEDANLEKSLFSDGILVFLKNTSEPEALILYEANNGSQTTTETVWFETHLSNRRVLGLEAKDPKELSGKDLRDAENHDGSAGIVLSLFMPYFCADDYLCSASVKADGNCSLMNAAGENTISYLLDHITYNDSQPPMTSDEVNPDVQGFDWELYSYYRLESFTFELELICVGDDNEQIDMIHLSAGHNVPLKSSDMEPMSKGHSLTLTDFLLDATDHHPTMNSRCGPLQYSASNHSKDEKRPESKPFVDDCVKPHTSTTVLYSLVTDNSQDNAAVQRRQLQVTPDDTSIYVRGNVAGWLEVIADMAPNATTEAGTTNVRKKTRVEFKMPAGRWLREGTYHLVNNTALKHNHYHACRKEYHLEIWNLPNQVCPPDGSESDDDSDCCDFLSSFSQHLFNGTLLIHHVEFDRYTGDIQVLDMSIRMMFLNSSRGEQTEVERDGGEQSPSDNWLIWTSEVKFRLPTKDRSGTSDDAWEQRQRPEQATWDLQKTKSFVILQQTPSARQRPFVHTYNNDRIKPYQHWISDNDEDICCLTLLLGGSRPFTNITFCSNLYLDNANSLNYGYEILWASDVARRVQHERTGLFVNGKNVSMDHRYWEFRLYQLDYDDVDGTITEFSADLFYANRNSSSITARKSIADSNNDFTLVWVRIHTMFRPNLPLTTMRTSDEMFYAATPKIDCTEWSDMFLYRSDWNPLWMGNIQHPTGYRNADSLEWEYWGSHEPYPRYYGYDGARYVQSPANYLQKGGSLDSESDIRAGENGLAWILSALGTAVVARLILKRRRDTSTSNYQHVRQATSFGRRRSRRGVVVDPDGWNAGLELTELT